MQRGPAPGGASVREVLGVAGVDQSALVLATGFFASAS